MASTSERTLRLLSLLQTRRYWPGEELARQLRVSPRTLRPDRVAELAQPVDVPAQRPPRDLQLPGQLLAWPVPAGLQQGQQPQCPRAGAGHILILAQFRSKIGRYCS